MDQKQAEVISHSITSDGNSQFLIFIPVEIMSEPHVLDLNKITGDWLTQVKATDDSINFDPERGFIIGWASDQFQRIQPSPVGPVDLDGNVTKDWRGIQYHQELEPVTHLLKCHTDGDLNGLLELKGITIGIERVVTHLPTAEQASSTL